MKITKLQPHILIAISTLLSCYKNNNPAPQPPNALSKWRRINTLPDEDITALEIINKVIYAGSTTSDKVYMSADNGATWTTSAKISQGKYIATLTLFRNKIYVGMDQAMFSSSDNGKTWNNEGDSTTSVTSFAIWNNNLYCSSYHDGVLMFDSNTKTWRPLSKGLSPGLYLDHIASKAIVIDNDLFAATALSFAAYNTTQQAWTRKSFFKNNADTAVWFPNYVIDMAYSQGILLNQIYTGARDQQTIMGSDNLGVTWYEDALNLRTDVKKYIMHGLLAGSSKFYSIANQDTLSIGTWIQQRERSAPAGSTWANNEEFLPSVRSSAIREYNGMLFLATDRGLYFKKL